ncbi:hypothetical protein ACN6MY_12225 [Peribacillus sp. B-H-3]
MNPEVILLDKTYPAEQVIWCEWDDSTLPVFETPMADSRESTINRSAR